MFSEMEVSRATKILLSRFVKRWMAWGTERWVFGEVLGCSVAPEQLCPRAADLKTPRPDAQHQETSLSGGPPSSVATSLPELGFDARGGSPRPPSLEMPCSLGGEASGSGRVPLAVITVTWGTRGPRRMRRTGHRETALGLRFARESTH